MVRKLLKWFAALVAIAVVAAGGVVGYGYFLFTTTGPLDEARNVVIPEGASVHAIAELLEENEVIDDAFIFRIWVRIHGAQTRMQAGEFRFPAHVSQKGAMRVLTDGRAVLRQVYFPEGWTTHQILERVRATEGLEGPVRTVPGEGELLPDTYSYVWGETRENLVQRMRDAMQRVLTDAWENRQEGLPLESPREALILASIIEKETAVGEERARVASVFVNRLRRGMRLQTDPTVIYGLTEGRGPLGRRLLRRDLRTEHPYNTYIITGLPPGPIANPSEASIRAALNPDDTDYLFFVADGTGGHAFAETYREHQRNVARWRRIRAQQEQERASEEDEAEESAE